jgi:hypothetical protein
MGNSYLLMTLVLVLIVLNLLLPIKAMNKIKKSGGLLKGKRYVILSYLAFPLSFILFLIYLGIQILNDYG